MLRIDYAGVFGAMVWASVFDTSYNRHPVILSLEAMSRLETVFFVSWSWICKTDEENY